MFIDLATFVKSLHRAEFSSYSIGEMESFIKGVRCTLHSLGYSDDLITSVRCKFYDIFLDPVSEAYIGEKEVQYDFNWSRS